MSGERPGESGWEEREKALQEEAKQARTRWVCLGMQVLYIAYGTPNGEFKSEPKAAILTSLPEGEDEVASVFVMNPSGLFFNAIKHGTQPGCWCLGEELSATDQQRLMRKVRYFGEGLQ